MSKTYDTIDEYFSFVKSRMLDFDVLISISEVSFEKRTSSEGLIRGYLEFIDRSKLHILEYSSIENKFLKQSSYRFHWEAADKSIIRWDNAPHHRELDNFPYHKHFQKNIESTIEMNFCLVLEELSQILKTSNYS